MAALLAFALLIGLGAWQLQRKTWKEHLLARIAALQTAPPEPLGVVLNRVRDGGELEFVRVMVTCDGLGARAVHLYGLRAGPDIGSGQDTRPGWRQITACRLPGDGPYGSLLVDLGFEHTPAMAQPVVEPLSLPKSGAQIVGVLRTPEPRPWFATFIGLGARRTPQSQASGQWFERDIPGMAAALDAPRPAPVMLMLEQPSPGPGLSPAAIPVDIPNRHFEYALTWFGLAGVLAVFYGVALVRGRAGRR